MPWGLKCFHNTGQSHFVTFCCYHRSPLFIARQPMEIFERALERVWKSFDLRVYGYVVMPEHVHLLLSEPHRGTLADALKSLKQGAARRLIGTAPLKPKTGLSGQPGYRYRRCASHKVSEGVWNELSTAPVTGSLVVCSGP